jgi:hypothetical protein
VADARDPEADAKRAERGERTTAQTADGEPKPAPEPATRD